MTAHRDEAKPTGEPQNWDRMFLLRLEFKYLLFIMPRNDAFT